MKVNFNIKFLCFTIIAIFFAGSCLSINHYYPVIMLLVFFSICSLFHSKIHMNIEHFCVLILIIIVTLNIQTSLNNLDISKSIFSVFLLLVMFFVLTLHVPTIEDLKMISKSFIISGLIISLYMLFFKESVGDGRFSYVIYNETVEPNYLATYLCITFLCSLKSFISSNKKIFFLLSCLAILYAILLTGSRGAFVSIIISVFFLISQKTKYFIPIGLLILVLMILSFYFLPIELANRFISDSYNDGSNRLRLYLWTTAFDFILKKPLFGYGLVSGIAITNIGSAHNTFLAILLNLGIIGFSAYLIIFIKIIKTCISKDMRFFLSIFVCILITSGIIDNQTSIVFYLVLIFLIFAVNLKNNNPDITLWDKI